MGIRFVSRALALASLAGWSWSAAASPGSFTGLGTVGVDAYGTAANESFGRAVSSDGSVAVGLSCCPGVDTAFRWQSDTISALASGKATAASSDGSVVVGESGGQAYRWATPGLLLGAGPGSTATGVSADGSVVVGNRASGAFRWASGILTDLGPLPAGSTSSAASAISDNGLVIVGHLSQPTGDQPFRWTSAGFEILAPLPAGFMAGRATAVSADGSTVVGFLENASGSRAFRWTAGSYAWLGEMVAGGTSEAWGVSDNGDVVVGHAEVAGGGAQPFVWSPAHGMRDMQVVLTSYGLDLTGWDLYDGNGVSANGRTFVGTGNHSNDEAFLASLPGAPEILALVISSLAGLGTTEIQNAGARQALEQWLTTATTLLASADSARSPQAAAAKRAQAVHAIRNAISRTDGCALGGAVDSTGRGRDWVLTCSAQAAIYGRLHDALLAL